MEGTLDLISFSDLLTLGPKIGAKILCFHNDFHALILTGKFAVRVKKNQVNIVFLILTGNFAVRIKKS